MGTFLRIEPDAATDGAVATVRLLRPRISGTDPRVPEELIAAAEQLDADPAVRAVVLYGGRRVFGSGADVKDLAERSPAEVDAYTGRLHTALDALARIGKPVVAAITGYALGGGLELALCADLRVAGEGAVLGLPEIELGVIPGTGGTQRLPRLIGAGPAKRLILTGTLLTAAEALRIGLVDETVPDPEVYEAALRTARRFAAGPTAALAAAKRAVDDGLDLPLGAGLDLERRQFTALFATEDQRIGMRAQLDGTRPAFLGR
ncbi:enoyl-CoA hydratase/isomerase family protein [Kitasatospora purpeofusca]|uniref:enoyl-CoA hydratase/isomerase family protein n=1 Tax=Kitasatospora purpeofusca TaxID=67352 RepID=UPI00364F6EBC